MPKVAKKTPSKQEVIGERVFPNTISPTSVEFVKGPQYSAFYSNNVSFAVNVLDFVLTFGETIEATAERAVVEQRSRITMHPVQAKVLMILLMRNIQAYEALNGTIPIPSNAVGVPSDHES